MRVDDQWLQCENRLWSQVTCELHTLTSAQYAYQCTVHVDQCTVHSTLWPVHSELTSAQCTVRFDQCTVHLPVHSAQNTYQCTVHVDQCTVQLPVYSTLWPVHNEVHTHCTRSTLSSQAANLHQSAEPSRLKTKSRKMSLTLWNFVSILTPFGAMHCNVVKRLNKSLFNLQILFHTAWHDVTDIHMHPTYIQVWKIKSY